MVTDKELRECQADPVAFTKLFLEAELWDRQREIAWTVAENDLVAVKSGHGVGKSFLASCLLLWFLFMKPPPCKVVSTAPTNPLVKKILWAEIAERHRTLKKNIAYAGELLQLELRLGENHFAYGFSTDQPDAMQGAHAKNLMLILDEACGISREICEPAETMASATGNKMFLIGNPTNPLTYFHDCFTGDVSGYKCLSISSTECPNVRYNEATRLYEDVVPAPFPGLVGARWINQKIATYGKNSNWCKARIFAEFPSQSSDQLIDGRHVAAALLKGKLIRGLLEKLDSGSEVLSSGEIARLKGGR
jgi:hypothetical protein